MSINIPTTLYKNLKNPLILRDSYGHGMGIVSETYHKGVPLLGVPENPTDFDDVVTHQLYDTKMPLFFNERIKQKHSVSPGCTIGFNPGENYSTNHCLHNTDTNRLIRILGS